MDALRANGWLAVAGDELDVAGNTANADLAEKLVSFGCAQPSLRAERSLKKTTERYGLRWPEPKSSGRKEERVIAGDECESA